MCVILLSAVAFVPGVLSSVMFVVAIFGVAILCVIVPSSVVVLVLVYSDMCHCSRLLCLAAAPDWVDCLP